ncbi:MAG TPA: FeoA family protein [Spirochaetia bacterium]|nr:FeoA family protein [Spirochaetia bacterium]
MKVRPQERSSLRCLAGLFPALRQPVSPCRCDSPENCNCPEMCANREWAQAVSDSPLPPDRTLQSLRPGDRARIEGLSVPQALKRRLLSLGLTWGTEVAVISKEGGRMIIAVRDSRLGLGPETAARIQCQPV